MPEVYLSTSKVRIQVFTINGENLDCWNHPNMLSLKNRMGERKIEQKSDFFVKHWGGINKFAIFIFSNKINV